MYLEIVRGGKERDGGVEGWVGEERRRDLRVDETLRCRFRFRFRFRVRVCEIAGDGESRAGSGGGGLFFLLFRHSLLHLFVKFLGLKQF